MSLPIYQDPNKNLMLMQTQWSSMINPVIDLPINSGHVVPNISITTGTNQINHGLGRKLQGWVVSRMRSSFIQLYDLQDTNPMPDKTLNLISNGSGKIDLLVF